MNYVLRKRRFIDIKILKNMKENKLIGDTSRKLYIHKVQKMREDTKLLQVKQRQNKQVTLTTQSLLLVPSNYNLYMQLQHIFLHLIKHHPIKHQHQPMCHLLMFHLFMSHHLILIVKIAKLHLQKKYSKNMSQHATKLHMIRLTYKLIHY